MPSGLKDGLRLNWSERQGPGPSVLLLHCSLANNKAWRGVIEALGPAPHVIAPDLPGHGRTEHDKARGVVEQAAAGPAVLLDGPAHVVGHSFRAVAGMYLALHRPDLVASLTLYEPVLFGLLDDVGDPAWAREVALGERLEAAFEEGSEAATAVFLDRWNDGERYEDMPAEQQAALAGLIHMIPYSRGPLYEDAPDRIRAGDLPGITAPTTLMMGEKTAEIFS